MHSIELSVDDALLVRSVIQCGCSCSGKCRDRKAALEALEQAFRRVDESLHPLLSIGPGICRCCGKAFGELPPTAVLTVIGGWHRVRIKTANDLEGSTTEIGCGNDPAAAVRDAWEWYRKSKNTSKEGMKANAVQDYGS